MITQGDPDDAGTGAPIRRTAKDEEADLQATLQNFVNGAYTEWPNEAGFDGLTEEQGPIELKVTGTIPAWAAGSLYRTGPGQYKIDDIGNGKPFYTTHWFDGLAHTHRFDIVPSDKDHNIKVLYSSRRQSQQVIQRIQRDCHRPFVSFGQRMDPCLGLFSKVMASWRAAWTDPEKRECEVVNVAVVPNFPGLDNTNSGHRPTFPRTIHLTTDSSVLRPIDPETLAPVGPIQSQKALHPHLKGPLSCAHPQIDPLTGDLYNFNLDLGPYGATYRIFRVGASTGQTEILATISSSTGIKAAYIHSFFLSPSFVVLCVPSSHLGWGGIKVVWNRNLADTIEPFDEGKKLKWIIVDRLGDKGVLGTFETDAGFFFHSVNAFEEETSEETDEDEGGNNFKQLVCDLVKYPTMDVIKSFEYDIMLQKDGADKNFWGEEGGDRARNCQPSLERYRFRVPLGTTKTSLSPFDAPERLFSIPSPHIGELPTINPRFRTRCYRYVYSLPCRGRGIITDTIAKTDTVTREVLQWNNPAGHSPGEAIFVPRPDGTEEDDGVLLSVVLDGFAKRSYLLCLDARTMKELGRAEVGIAVGFGFHGVHCPISS